MVHIKYVLMTLSKTKDLDTGHVLFSCLIKNSIDELQKTIHLIFCGAIIENLVRAKTTSNYTNSIRFGYVFLVECMNRL